MGNNTTKPLVSIIIPLYNCAEYIDECLNSVLNQEVSDIEVIVVDDGSTDEGAKSVKKFKNVKLIQQPNQGVTAARKSGVTAAGGEWIMFVDADDTVGENIISCWLPLMRDDVDMIVGRMQENKEVNKDQLIYDILGIRHFPKAPWLKMFRRELFDSSNAFDIPREIVWGEDMLMLLRLSNNVNKKVVYSKDKNYDYRRHSDQVSTTFLATSGYEYLYRKLLLESVPAEKIDSRFMAGAIRYQLSVYERMLKEAKYTNDNVRESEWFKALNEDMKRINYHPSLWFKVLLRYGSKDNIRRLRSIKWIFRCFKAF